MEAKIWGPRAAVSCVLTSRLGFLEGRLLLSDREAKQGLRI
jgi:hypothetical protein